MSIRLCLLQQWLAATLVSMLPLLLAAGYSAHALQHQIDLQRQLMSKQDRLIAATSALQTQATAMTRTARQYQLLAERSFLQLFEQHQSAVISVLGELEQLHEDDDPTELLQHIRLTSEEVQTLLQRHLPDVEADILNTALLSIREDIEQLAQMTESLRRGESRQLEENFTTIVYSLLTLLLLAFPVTLLLMALGGYTITRPIWQLTSAIRNLGQSRFDTPIQVRGPADLTALGEQLDWMRQQILAADRQKIAFVQHVTHELKTPLAAVIDAGNLLAEEIPSKLDPAQKPVLEILRRNAWNLQEMIQQLLNFNAVSHGLAVRQTSVDIASLCEDIRKALLASGNGGAVRWRFVGRPATVKSDPVLLEMILSNLLTNAVQYCGKNGAVIVSWSQQSQYWQLSVHDNGPGIAAHEIDQVFLPFYCGSGSKPDNKPHNGLGLAIVRTCVTLLAGDIRIDSSSGAGATFLLRFPLTSGPKKI